MTWSAIASVTTIDSATDFVSLSSTASLEAAGWIRDYPLGISIVQYSDGNGWFLANSGNIYQQFTANSSTVTIQTIPSSGLIVVSAGTATGNGGYYTKSYTGTSTATSIYIPATTYVLTFSGPGVGIVKSNTRAIDQNWSTQDPVSSTWSAT